jgi:hypothetical protein
MGLRRSAGRRRIIAVAGGVTAGVAIAALAVSPAVAKTTSAKSKATAKATDTHPIKGSATGISVSLNGLAAITLIPTPTTGFAFYEPKDVKKSFSDTKDLLDIVVPGSIAPPGTPELVNSRTLSVHTEGNLDGKVGSKVPFTNDYAKSSAFVEDLTLLGAINVRLLDSSCSVDGKHKATGTSNVLGLTIQGNVVIPPGSFAPPNTSIPLAGDNGPIGTVYINEQVVSDGGSAITVNALRVHLNLLGQASPIDGIEYGDIIVAQSVCAAHLTAVSAAAIAKKK